jgi:mono/diheme cytochrome c family protein
VADRRVRRRARRTLAAAHGGAVLVVTASWTTGRGVVSAFAGPVGDTIAGFVEPSFPFIVSTLDAGATGGAFPQRNLAVRCVVLMLGDSTYACFDTDLLRVAAAWRGGFMKLTTMAQVSYDKPFNKNNAIPQLVGTPIVATGIYPGWMGSEPAYRDPRPAGPNPSDIGRGPIAAERGRWNGLHVVGKQAVLSYTVEGTSVDEQIGTASAEGQVGVTRTFRTGAIVRPITLVVGEVVGGAESSVDASTAVVLQGAARDTATVVGVTSAPAGASLQVDSNRYVTLRVPAGPASTFRVVAWRGRARDRAVVDAMLRRPVTMTSFERGGPSRWDSTVVTHGSVSPDTADYVVDRIALPTPNPWHRNVRVSDVDFFVDGRAAVVTFDGDVWIVSGIDRGLEQVRWKRFASGLYEPLNVKVLRDTIYVLDREGIVRLVDVNGDGEADAYENFSNVLVQSGESREYPLGLAAKPGGGFYVSIGGALDNGPKTSPQIAPGFRAGSIHSGSVQEISADGMSIRPFATGLREPNIGSHPRSGALASSDQQGNFVPATPVYLLRQGGYYNVPPTAHGADTSARSAPLVWIPHEVDASGAGEVWVTDGHMGFVGDALVHLSYARPGPFRVYVDSTRSAVQGATVALPGAYTTPTLKGRMHPRDGQLYLAGFQIWQSNAKDVSSLVRLRSTGRPSTIPIAVHAGAQGILLRFAARLDAVTARDPKRYTLESWHYQRTSAYGSGHFRRDGSAGHDPSSVVPRLSADGRSLLLVVPQMQPVEQMQLDYDLRSVTGAPIKGSLYLSVQSVDPLDLRAAGFGNLDWRALARGAAGASTTTPVASSAAEGAQIFQRVGCVACHSVDGTQAGKTGPTLKGVYGSRVPLTGKPARVADEAYLLQSILEPATDVVQGFEPGMPSFRGVLSEAQARSVVLYIEGLGKK